PKGDSSGQNPPAFLTRNRRAKFLQELDATRQSRKAAKHGQRPTFLTQMGAEEVFASFQNSIS
ncbi:MAG TPA: hypothetical protein PK971_07175, partial [Saprospiraceae bacterium]|nr:hypothetical protein [Saprospiraceae bacterium]